MSELPTYRATQDVHARVVGPDQEEIEVPLVVAPIAALSGDTYPSLADIRKQFDVSDALARQAADPDNRSTEFTVYRGGDIRIDILRRHGLGRLLSRAGLKNFAYEPYTVVSREALAAFEKIEAQSV